MIRKNLLFLGFTLGVVTAQAQNEGTLYFMNTVPQVSYLNPAVTPRYRFSLGLPGSSAFVQYANSGFNYNSFATPSGDSAVANLQKLSSKLRKKNYITNAVQADLLRVNVKVNARLFLMLNVTAKAYDRVMLPKDLTAIFVNGTAAFVGGQAKLSPKAEALSYVEFGFGGAYKYDRKLTIGARVKILKGLVNATTKQATASLSLSQDYDITANATMDVRTSGIHNFTDDNYKIKDHWKDYTYNSGYGLDLGGVYQYDDRLTLSASIVDLGFITWKNDPYAYKLNPDSATYSFKGYDLQKVLDNNSDYLSHEQDTLAQHFKIHEGAVGKYRTATPAKLYFAARYKLRAGLYGGGVFFAEIFKGRFAPGVSCSINRDFGKRLTTSISYTASNNSYNNIGLGLSLNLPPFQLYVVGDNLLRAPLALASHGELNAYFNSMQVFNLRVGLNFVFGWEKLEDQKPKPINRR